jgi:hypothetical protein
MLDWVAGLNLAATSTLEIVGNHRPDGAVHALQWGQRRRTQFLRATLGFNRAFGMRCSSVR